MKKIFITASIFLIIGVALSYFASFGTQSFKNLSPEEMYQTIINERDYAIGEAIERGDYRCCINPPCTMCYLEANQWNNFTAGTCACDDLIAQGKEPCPQCQRGFCESCKLPDEIDDIT